MLNESVVRVLDRLDMHQLFTVDVKQQIKYTILMLISLYSLAFYFISDHFRLVGWLIDS